MQRLPERRPWRLAVSIFALTQALSVSCSTVSAHETTDLVKNGRAVGLVATRKPWTQKETCVELAGVGDYVLAEHSILEGYFRVAARLRMLGQRKSAAIFVLDGSAFGFEGARETIFLNGPLFGGQLRLLGSPTEFWKRDAWIDFEVERRGSEIEFRVDGKTLARADHEGSFGEFGFAPWRSTMHI